eukprot:m.137341 g.137341  ORF g.137341 m.137341 type:complete len:50 (-) comp16601_c4_seq1:67-216(-)
MLPLHFLLPQSLTQFSCSHLDVVAAAASPPAAATVVLLPRYDVPSIPHS